MNAATRSPADLTPHPAIKHLVGRWAPDSESALALRRSIQEHGLLQPLTITEDGRILDGVTRWQAAKALQLNEVPVTVRSEGEVFEVMLASEIRRHQTKGQRAFVFAPFVSEAFALRQRINAQMSKLPPNARNDFARSNKGGKTIADYAVELGVSPRMLEQGHELHRLFEAHPEKRSWTSDEAVANLQALGFKRGAQLSFAEYYTPLILAPEKPMALHNALTGMKSLLDIEAMQARGVRGRHKGSADVDAPRQLALFDEALKSLEIRYEYWTRFDEEAKAAAKTTIASALETMPDDLLAVWKQRILAEERRREAATL